MPFGPVSLREEVVVIPTYPVGAPERNPMFLEKRVYQGSSGKVYPLPTIDSIGDEKADREYAAVILENDFLLVLVLPELGGRIQRALDKTNGYDFVYYNRVIKPALVGLAGPWISGGIEFNWPQHHRPSTFMPVSCDLEERADGSKTVWVGEFDRMYGTRCSAGFTLYPDRAYIEISGRLHNGTQSNQSFLWWANPAVPANADARSVFPGDVHAVFDHGKRDLSKFPIATGVYYKHDYSEGVDIASYGNIPVPTSYMAGRSDFDFVGGYDYGREAGLLHVADHHLAPGKKQWTWGNGDFGRAWDRNLTDADGPYVELMTGVYTDNQPDFTWLKPGETKTFTQYFLPYKRLGQIADATKECLASLVRDGDAFRVGVYASVPAEDWRLFLAVGDAVLLDRRLSLKPGEARLETVPAPADVALSACALRVFDADGRTMIEYSPEPERDLVIPPPARKAEEPELIRTNEELYLAGIHLEQYRHATCRPEDYYLEGLGRDPGDMRINCAYADLALRRGRFATAEMHYRAAVARSNLHNANPRDGEAHYGLGLSLKLQDRLDEAKEHVFRALWDGDFAARGYFTLAQIAAARGEFAEALGHVDASLSRNALDSRALHLKCLVLRRLGLCDAAARVARAAVEADRLDFFALRELGKALAAEGDLDGAKAAGDRFRRIVRGEARNYLELAGAYEDCGAWDDAIEALSDHADAGGPAHPEIWYRRGYCRLKQGRADAAARDWERAEKAPADYCFPNRLRSLIALETAIAAKPDAARARYYLGCLLYDARRHDDAAALWEESAALDPAFPTVFRNLALYYYNKRNAADQALAALEKAFSLDAGDARILFELDQLLRKLGRPHGERLARLERHPGLVAARDDLYLEFVALHNNLRRHEEALALLAARNFHPWEGGEGKTVGQYVLANLELAKRRLAGNDAEGALAFLEAAKTYPPNLGEGKLPGTAENQLYYLLGLAGERLGDAGAAREAFSRAAAGSSEPAGVMYYNDQPADAIFHQGMALLRLGDPKAAKARFHKLYDYGEKHLRDKMRIDYFAVSLPDFLVFDEDLDRKNQAYCRYLMGLGLVGLGDRRGGEAMLAAAAGLDPNHQGAMFAWKFGDE
ncbi:MAG: DUF5107 domain-containing protein [Planctomycetota bacterium]|jgi:tetratricopeptide (TPR) repeat protein|nr:DUF5107 domain-containing protein [Planctomycetota bacterium]